MDNINNQTPNSPISNTAPSTPPSMPPLRDEPSNKPSAGPIIGSVIVVLVIVLGGLYIYGSRISEELRQEAPIENISAESDQSTAQLESQGSSDDLSEINADLNATNIDNLDQESAQIDQEFKAE